MEADYVQRLRLTFKKEGAARFISHLDLARALERALNRAKIPVAYTHGFNPRPRLQMASALPLGYTSEYELADVLLLEEMEPETARQQLMAKMAPGIDVYKMEAVPISLPSLQASTVASNYVATPLDPVDEAELQQKIVDTVAADSLMRTRIRKNKKREYDLRPLILDLSLQTEVKQAPQIKMHLMLQPSLTGRPDEVLQTLGLDPLDCRVHRTMIVLKERD